MLIKKKKAQTVTKLLLPLVATPAKFNYCNGPGMGKIAGFTSTGVGYVFSGRWEQRPGRQVFDDIYSNR